MSRQPLGSNDKNTTLKIDEFYTRILQWFNYKTQIRNHNQNDKLQ